MKSTPDHEQEAKENTREPCEVEPTMGEKAVRAFRRDLPALLKERPRQWVAYHGDQCLGFAETARELFRECIRRGIPDNEYIIRPIGPEAPDVINYPKLIVPPPPKTTRTAGQ